MTGRRTIAQNQNLPGWRQQTVGQSLLDYALVTLPVGMQLMPGGGDDFPRAVEGKVEHSVYKTFQFIPMITANQAEVDCFEVRGSKLGLLSFLLGMSGSEGEP